MEKYIGKPEFEKVAAIQLSKNPAEWEPEIVANVTEDHPYVFEGTDFNIVFKEIDEEEGNAFGVITVTRKKKLNYNKRSIQKAEPPSEQKIAMLPVIIQAFGMKSVDTFIMDGQHFVLTPERWASIMGTPELGTKLAAPDTEMKSIAHYTWPPAEAAYGAFGSHQGIYHYASDSPISAQANVNDRLFVSHIANTMYKSDVDAFKRRVNEDQKVVSAFARNKTLHIVKKIVDADAMSEKDVADAAYNMLPDNVIHVKLVNLDKFKICAVSDYQYSPKVCEVDFDKAVEMLQKVEPAIRERLMSEDEFFIVRRKGQIANPVVFEEIGVITKEVSGNGRYYVISNDGEILEGSCITGIMDYEGKDTGLTLFADGNKYALQEKISAEYINNALPIRGKINTGVAATFYYRDGDNLKAFLPFTIKSYFRDNGRDIIRAVDFWKNNITFIKTPEVKVAVYASGIKDMDIGSHLNANTIYIPDSYETMYLGQRIHLMDNVYTINQYFQKHLRDQVRHDHVTRPDGGVEIQKSGQFGEYTMMGPVIDSIFKVEKVEYLNEGQVKFALIVLGCSPERADKIILRCNEHNRCTVGGLRPVNNPELTKTADEYMKLAEFCKSLRKDLIKEASVLQNPDCVDKMLSLGFINKENIAQFMENLPAFQQTEAKLAELLTLSRVGLRDVDEGAVTSAMKSMNDVNQKLEYVESVMKKSPENKGDK